MIYPENLGSFLVEYPEYIPYQFSKIQNNCLKLYRRYYSYEGNIFKVLEIFNIFNTKYYNIKINNSLQAVISCPVYDILYELVPDHKNMINRNIINDDNWYTGAEIKYWFFIHNKNIEQDYPDFKQYLYIDSKSEINDTGLYKVQYNTKYGYGRIISKYR